MSAAPVHEVDGGSGQRSTAPARLAATAPVPESGASVLVTVQIAVTDGEQSAGAAAVWEHLRALLGLAAEVRVAVPERLPLQPSRPRLVPPLAGSAVPEFVVHEASRSVYRDRQPVRLTRREYDLFVFLASHPRRVFTRAQLLRRVWGYDIASGERTVDVHVRRLRTKLAAQPPVIATARGVGYRLAEHARVRVQPDAD